MDERDVCERLRHAAAVLAEVRVGELDAQNVRNAMGDLATVRRHAGRLDVALAARAGELCDRGTGEDPVDLLTDVGAMPTKRARQVVGHAELLGRMPLLASAVAAGTVSDDHVAAVATARRRVDPALRTELDRADEEITALAATHSPDALADRLRWLTSRIERQHQRQRSQRQARQARLTKWIDHDGMYQLRGAFDPDLGARIFTAVDTAVEALRQHPESLVPGHDPTDPLGVEPTFLAAHALAKLVGHGHMAQHPGLAEVVVLIDEMTLLDGSHDRSVCEFHDGSPADPDLVRRLCCDAIVRAVVVSADGRVPLSLGRTRRTPTGSNVERCEPSTAPAPSRAARRRSTGARSTMSGSGSSTVSPISTTSSRSVTAITTSCTTAVGGSRSTRPTERSPWHSPTAARHARCDPRDCSRLPPALRLVCRPNRVPPPPDERQPWPRASDVCPAPSPGMFSSALRSDRNSP